MRRINCAARTRAREPVNVSLPVMVRVPVTDWLLVLKMKVPVPLVGVSPLIVVLVSEPSSSVVSTYDVVGAFGAPSPSAFGKVLGVSVSISKQPDPAGTVYALLLVPPKLGQPYSPK